ncbi:MAG: Pyridoxal-5-phosphate-dependent protein beta subunit [Gemmatimonadetes bacterium]|nr:Pyridoxal-5-phosphate-dependent protein beta subunit [Gemmatimonadota bacterium]
MELTAPTLDAVHAARARITGIALRTPLVRLQYGTGDVWLKLENLQPIGSFKLRGAANAMALAGVEAMRSGVYTASAGNMAQGVAWCARELGVRCRVVVPEHAPNAKTDAIGRLGSEVIRVPFDVWWKTLVDHGYPGMEGVFVHPFADDAVMAGNGTIALEIFEDIGDVNTIVVPYGGGGLACGIAAAARALSPATKVYAVEAETAAPLTASLGAGAPTPVTRTQTFIDGMGSGAVFGEMWPLVQSLLAGTVVVSVAQVASAVKLLAERARVVAEGAGAAAVAAALGGALEGQRVVCIVSGGNIDLDTLSRILTDQLP